MATFTHTHTHTPLAHPHLNYQNAHHNIPRNSSRVGNVGAVVGNGHPHAFPDLHHRMSKKIAQLTQVIYILHTKNDEHAYEKKSLNRFYQNEVKQVCCCGVCGVVWCVCVCVCVVCGVCV